MSIDLMTDKTLILTICLDFWMLKQLKSCHLNCFFSPPQTINTEQLLHVSILLVVERELNEPAIVLWCFYWGGLFSTTKSLILECFERCCLSNNLYDRGLFLIFAYTLKKKKDLFIFFLLCGLKCMQSGKCPQMVLLYRNKIVLYIWIKQPVIYL